MLFCFIFLWILFYSYFAAVVSILFYFFLRGEGGKSGIWSWNWDFGQGVAENWFPCAFFFPGEKIEISVSNNQLLFCVKNLFFFFNFIFILMFSYLTLNFAKYWIIRSYTCFSAESLKIF